MRSATRPVAAIPAATGPYLSITLSPMIILRDRTLQVAGPDDIVPPLQEWFHTLDTLDRQKEHLIVVLLDARNRVKQIDVTSVGTLNASLVHPREVFVRAIQHLASTILIAHNHPSGHCEPSDADDMVTKRLVAAGAILGIEVTDHIIIVDEHYYSFREHGKL